MSHVDASQPEFVAAVRTTQIIVAALAAGVALFAVVVLQMHGVHSLPKRWEDVDLTAASALLFAVLVLPVQVLVPRLVVAGAIRMQGLDDPAQPDAPESWKPWFGLYQTQTILACALCEGIAFLNLAFYMLFQETICLAGAAWLWVVLLTKFPTPGKVGAWIEAQWRKFRDEAQFGRAGRP